jgi:hypothetical protein
MPRHFKSGCPNCGQLIWPRYIYCPFCGIDLDTERTPYVKDVLSKQASNGTKRAKREFIKCEEIRKVLKPLIDMNGVSWLAMRLDVDESRIRAVMKNQIYVSYDLCERWLIKLGIENALVDGTMDVSHITHWARKTQIPEEPPNLYFEN